MTESQLYMLSEQALCFKELLSWVQAHLQTGTPKLGDGTSQRLHSQIYFTGDPD
jgi:hypothetical protein